MGLPSYIAHSLEAGMMQSKSLGSESMQSMWQLKATADSEMQVGF